MAALFEDSYCRLTGEELVIKCFYFPTGQAKHIDIKTIKGVYFREQRLRGDCCKVKGWGMSFTPCWWACDLRRSWHSGPLQYYNVVIDCGEKTYKGFTVNDINAFTNEVKKVIHPEAVVSGDLPF